MFPEQFVRKHVVTHTDAGDVVFDPFSGRGTTVLESLLLGRLGFGTDPNPVAVCLSNAKANPPTEAAVMRRLRLLEAASLSEASPAVAFNDPFFELCFHQNTFNQITFLRSVLDWRADPVDCFIAAVVLNCLHGESHKTRNCFSNRMPRTVSTKKQYAVRWWTERGLTPPNRNVFDILRYMSGFRLATQMPGPRGLVEEADARDAAARFPDLRRRVSLVVTSPPYLDMTDYREDQWLRLWFLGGPPEPQRGHGDDRHKSARPYWMFLAQAWAGVRPLLAPGAVVVVRIGGTQVTFDEARERLLDSLRSGLLAVTPLDDGFCSEIVGRQTGEFRPGTAGKRFEFDFRYRFTG